jgi:hypothetical protein
MPAWGFLSQACAVGRRGLWPFLSGRKATAKLQTYAVSTAEAIRSTAQDLVREFFLATEDQAKPPEFEAIKNIVDKIARRFPETKRAEIDGMVKELFTQEAIDNRTGFFLQQIGAAHGPTPWDLNNPAIRHQVVEALMSEFGATARAWIEETVERQLARLRHLQDQEVFTRAEAAKFLHMSVSLLDKLVAQKRITPNRETRKPLFPRAELQRFLDLKRR